ncbi:hypothetical protein NBM05_14905 [Rothia sp. AR01]|uniref:Uncharacterized protein n=1 Tax=Rothia santali TaxID=2949643 RepID=A0A9X2HCT0_9MICC|nr:hypothetical protein [Rothia santali]MCP3427259.1 hypothetical protein [Rothia santali]
MPQISVAGKSDVSCSRAGSGIRSHTQIPSKASSFFAHRFASFARSFVVATPTQTGRPI